MTELEQVDRYDVPLPPSLPHLSFFYFLFLASVIFRIFLLIRKRKRSADELSRKNLLAIREEGHHSRTESREVLTYFVRLRFMSLKAPDSSCIEEINVALSTFLGRFLPSHSLSYCANSFIVARIVNLIHSPLSRINKNISLFSALATLEI